MGKAENDAKKAKIAKILGQRKNIVQKPYIVPAFNPYPRRHAMGKNKFSEHGVGGLRQQYHRPESADVNPLTMITTVVSSIDEPSSTPHDQTTS